MSTNSTLLCIHRDPAQVSLLQQGGYQLLTATTGRDGLRLFMSRPVDAIVLDYQLGLLDGGVVAAEIKKVKPRVPIVMLAGDMELPEDALKAVDALVSKSDCPDSLLATVRSVLNRKPAQPGNENSGPQASILRRRPGRSREKKERRQASPAQSATNEKGVPFSPGVWRSIRNGTFQF